MKQVEALYNTYFHDVYLFVKSLSKSDEIAEEITQETFFKAMKSLQKFKGDCDVRVWLCQIAKNTYYNHCTRNRQTASDTIEETAADVAVTIEESLEDAQQTMQIHHILHTMDDCISRPTCPTCTDFLPHLAGDCPRALPGKV